MHDQNSAPSESKRPNGGPPGGSTTSCTSSDEGRTRRYLESILRGVRTRQTDHAIFLYYRKDGCTPKFTSIRIETTKLRTTWWVDDILHLQRRRQDQQVPRVDTSRCANATNGPCYLTLLSKRWMHPKIELHPNRNDQVEVHVVGRRHPAPPATKAGPGGTSSRYLKLIIHKRHALSTLRCCYSCSFSGLNAF